MQRFNFAFSKASEQQTTLPQFHSYYI